MRAGVESFEASGGFVVVSVMHLSRSQEALPKDVGLNLLGSESEV